MFDYLFGVNLFEQYSTKDYANTSGRITHGEVVQPHRLGRHYDVDIRYHYEVNRRSFEGTRFRCIRVTSLSSAQNVVAAHPVGSTTKVFYNPKDPRDSVLSAGIEQSDLYGLLFLIPFNLVMVFQWYRSGRASPSC